jgi:catalase
MRFDGNEYGTPVYHPNTFNGPIITGQPDSQWSIENTTVARFESGQIDNYEQAAIFWNSSLDAGAQQRLVNTIAGGLGGAVPRIQSLMLTHFDRVNATMGQMLRSALGM